MADINYNDFENMVIGGLTGKAPAVSNVVSLTSLWEQPTAGTTGQVLDSAFNFG